MLEICGYNFVLDLNALDQNPTNLTNLTSVQLENAEFDNIDISRNVVKTYSNVVPAWDYNTILDCNFNENVAGGNINLTLAQITSVRIKRRLKNTFDWILLEEYPITTYEDLIINTFDNYSPSGYEWEYAIVPTLNSVEGNYIISSINSDFNGIFICQGDTTFKLFNGVSYDGVQSMQDIAQHSPIGRKYPVIVSNSVQDYKTGSINGLILNDDFDTTRTIDRNGLVEQVKIFDALIKNKKPKIIKDWNGNAWLVMVVGNPSYTFNNSYGMGVQSVNFQWTEQGDIYSEDDLYNNGLIDVKE